MFVLAVVVFVCFVSLWAEWQVGEWKARHSGNE